MGLLTDAPSHAALAAEAGALGGTHLRELLQGDDRPLTAEFAGVVLDYSRQKLTAETLALLEQLYAEQGVAASMAANQAGAMQNPTEERSVLHTALRASRSQTIPDKDGHDVVPEFVCEALRYHAPSAAASHQAGRTLRFLANVDPTDVFRATADLDPEETLVVVISKTFTTAETSECSNGRLGMWLLPT